MAAAIACAVPVVVIAKKESLVQETASFLRNMLRRETSLDIKIGKVSGNIFGVVKLNDLRIQNPSLPEGRQTLFFAKQIRVHYRFLDLLSKKFASKIQVDIEEPEWHWNPYASLRSGGFPFFSWMKKWAISQRSRWKLGIHGFKIMRGEDPTPFQGIDVVFENDQFEMKLPLRHLEVVGSDVSSEVNVKGRFQDGVFHTPDSFIGEIYTEGTVVNWKPVTKEARFDFVLSKTDLNITSSDFLGGIQLRANIDFENGNAMDGYLSAKNYSLENLAPFFTGGPRSAIPRSVDLEVAFKGETSSPDLEARLHLYGGIGGNSFKVMDVHVRGVYPTMQLTDSHLVMDDGTVMNFAERALEVRDLFSNKTYYSLISDAQQSKVVVGSWQFNTPKDAQDAPEVLMQRSMGENLSLHLKKEVEEEGTDSLEKKPVEVGFEYKLKSEDFLKFDVKEDERFFGVERKMKF